jgi:hypothetical protein
LGWEIIVFLPPAKVPIRDFGTLPATLRCSPDEQKKSALAVTQDLTSERGS